MSSYYPPSRPQSSPVGVVALVVMVLLLLAVPVLVGWWLWQRSHPHPAGDAVPRTVTPRGDLAADEKATIDLYKKASRSVVHITSLTARRSPVSMNVQQVPKGTGSGFVWDKQGHVVTNFHVIEGANAAQVTLADHSSWPADLVGAYPDKDVAVLRIKAGEDRLFPIDVGTSEDLQVGQKVFAIGNPFGLDQTLTTGVISALNREIESVTQRPIRGVIQTDAAINPGNSGGPLLDSSARLIGVNTAIYSPSGTSAGIGFAIPADEVNRAVPQIINHGKVVRPGLGVQVAPDRLAREKGLKGVLVLAVVPDSPAATAGIRPTQTDDSGQIELGDVIVAIDGKAVKTAKDLFATLDGYKAGDTVTVRVLRDGQPQDIKVTLAEVG
jgi:S1-C subfamily serine protease